MRFMQIAIVKLTLFQNAGDMAERCEIPGPIERLKPAPNTAHVRTPAQNHEREARTYFTNSRDSGRPRS